MSDKARHYFVYGNTAQGFISKLASNLQGIDKLFILRGQPVSAKAFMKEIAGACENTGYHIEYLHCPSAPDTYDGIIIPEIKRAIVDSTDLHYTKLMTLQPTAQFIDLDSVFDGAQLSESKAQNADLIINIGICHESAFQCFAEALHVHDEWEKIYIENMDFSKANLLTAYTSELLLGGHALGKTPVSKFRFFGASTPTGALDYIENLTGALSKRYLLKGRPGSGKSTLLRKLAADSSARGLNTEIYHCAFDSKSLDMIIWPELDVCLFDSTSPHLYEPSKPNDEIIDMYAACVAPGTDEKYESALSDITNRYQKAVQNGTAFLTHAKVYLDALVEGYANISDASKIQGLCHEISSKLLR